MEWVERLFEAVDGFEIDRDGVTVRPTSDTASVGTNEHEPSGVRTDPGCHSSDAQVTAQRRLILGRIPGRASITGSTRHADSGGAAV